MVALLKKNSVFLIPYFLFLALGSIVLAAFSKTQVHLFFNEHHISKADVFFRYATYLGDGITPVVITFFLLFVKYRAALIFGLANLVSAGVTQLLKHTVFSDYVRPANFFKDTHPLNFVTDVEIFFENSFPSGHTTCAFATFFCLALFTENNFLKLTCFVTACTAAYSRIYLNQHFFNDIYAGSVIGVIATLCVYFYVNNNQNQKLENSLLKKTNY